MTNNEELRIRQLILYEYQSGISIEQAFANINAKINSVVISRSRIGYWYQRFKSSNISLFNQNNEQHGITAPIRKMVRNSKK
jgi:hypothetical protein